MSADAEHGAVPRTEPGWSNEAAAVPGSVSQMRRAVVEFAAANGADDRTQSDIALAVSEAITNSVLHAYVGAAPGMVRLEATLADDHLYVTISDDGRGVAPRRDSPGLGLGLPTIALLAASVTITPGPNGRGTTVLLAFPLR